MQGKAIWVAIPTFRRPDQLRHLLDTLPEVVGGHEVTILVADNDARDREGAAVVAELERNGYPLPLSVISVEQPGLCAVRNAIVHAALDDPAMRFLAMIDDDEWPQPGWLDALLACQAQTGAHVVAGPVDSCFIGETPRWAEKTLVFRPEDRAGGETGMLWACNNLLVRREALEMIPSPWFDQRFNRCGSEDLDFLARLKQAGARFGWAADARVNEWVPAERARRSWVLQRMWRIGFSETLARRKHMPGIAGGLALFSRTFGLLVFRTVGLITLLLPGAHRMDIAGQWIKCWGRLYALMGGTHRHYGAL